MIGFISSKSKRAELGQEPVRQSLLVTRYDPERAEKEECLRLEDIKVSLSFSTSPSVVSF
jgi:septum site-determining protein MinD